MRKLSLPWEVKRETLVRSEAETDYKHGCPVEKRPLTQHIRYGFVNVDKPPGPSSHEVTAWVRKILGITHVGHGGTLEVRKAGDIPA